MTVRPQLRQRKAIRQSRPVSVTSIVAIALSLSGCGTGADLAALDDDPTLITGSIQPADVAATSAVSPVVSAHSDEIMSDRDAIVGMAMSADLDALGGEALAWRNSKTESRGAIRDIREVAVGTAICRQFTASRQNYSGVALWTGEICRRTGEDWRVTNFQKV